MNQRNIYLAKVWQHIVVVAVNVRQPTNALLLEKARIPGNVRVEQLTLQIVYVVEFVGKLICYKSFLNCSKIFKELAQIQ